MSFSYSCKPKIGIDTDQLLKTKLKITKNLFRLVCENILIDFNFYYEFYATGSDQLMWIRLEKSIKFDDILKTAQHLLSVKKSICIEDIAWQTRTCKNFEFWNTFFCAGDKKSFFHHDVWWTRCKTVRWEKLHHYIRFRTKGSFQISWKRSYQHSPPIHNGSSDENMKNGTQLGNPNERRKLASTSHWKTNQCEHILWSHIH